MQWFPAKHLTPTRYLAVVNVFTSGLGFVQGLIVLRSLGPELVGVIAVIGGINATVLNFLDVRLTDLAGKLYYETDGRDENAQRGHRASVLLLCVGGNALISLFLAAGGWMLCVLLVHKFADGAVEWWWLMVQPLVLGLNNIGNTVSFLQRFSERFYLFGTARLLIQIISIGVFITTFLLVKGINGYYLAALVGGTLSLSCSGLVTVYVWAQKDRLPIFSTAYGTAVASYRRHLKFLFFGNLLGYTKLLHRAADTLVVGWFTDDRTTGLYKFARSLTDSLYILFDAMNQVYQPKFLSFIARAQTLEYRNLASRILATCALFTASVVLTEMFLLRSFLEFVFGARYHGSETASILMTVPFFFVAGVSTWMWPLFIHSGRLGRFTAAAALAALVQCGSTIVLLVFVEKVPAMAGIGYLLYYLALYPIGYFMVSRRFPEHVPQLSR